MRKINRMAVFVFCLCALCTLTPALMAEQAAEGKVTEHSGCSATADCWNGTHVSCFGDLQCTLQNSSCPFARGYVECDGERTYCPSCPQCSKEGDLCDYVWDCRPPGEIPCQFCDCFSLKGEPGFCVCPG